MKRIAFDLCLALLQLQQEGIVHGDIKPENIFLNDVNNNSCASFEDDNSSLFSSASSSMMTGSEGLGKTSVGQSLAGKAIHEVVTESTQVLLGDFGNAFHFQTESQQYHHSFEVQSLPYRAPEVLLGLPFSTSIDMWSLGVVLVEVCLRRPWFVCTERKEVLLQLHSDL